MKSDPTTITEEDREEMQRLIRTCLGLISRGAPDGAAEYARRAAELGKRIGRRWHRETKAASDRQGTFAFDRGWTWAGEGRDGRAANGFGRLTKPVARAEALGSEAERKAGELLAKMDKNPGARGGKTRSRDVSALKDLGVEYMQSSRWQRMASVPDKSDRALQRAGHET